jgi:hypothetical protein
VVLGYDWLSRYNPLIDWAKSSIDFRTPEEESQYLLTSPTLETETLAPPNPRVTVETVSDEPPPRTAPHISFVNAAAFSRAARMPDAEVFILNISDPTISGHSSTISEDPSIDLMGVPKEYHDFADVFSQAKASTLPPHRPYDLKINLEEGKDPPPTSRIYLHLQEEVKALQQFIADNLWTGFICSSSSVHGAPVLFIWKKNSELRLCVDFRGLNKITRKDHYPLPLTADLLDTAGKARIDTKIDLRHAYHLVQIAEGDEWKTAFRTRYRSFEWLVMPFGLVNAPAAFQHFMNDIFSDLLDVCVIDYLDDILVYSDDSETHSEHVREVLSRLRKHGLYAAPDKCSFHATTVEYLGFILSPEGLKMDPMKVNVITDWPEPRKVKDVQSFLGFCNFYRRFIHAYADIALPLAHLTRKGQQWNFTEEYRSAFNELKSTFNSAPILSHFILDAPLIVETDASDYAIAGIISTITPDNDIHPIAFYSRTLCDAKLNYDTHDKELLAIWQAFMTWRKYLEGSLNPIDVVTDHKNLEYFRTTRLLTQRQVRWSEYLSQFNLVIRFHPGKLGTKPDALTRRWDVYAKEGDKGFASANPQNF